MKTILISLLMLIPFYDSFAQYGQHPEKREEIKKKQLLFITQELQLTDKEKIEFLPLYSEYDKKREDLHDQKRKLMHHFMINHLNMNNEQLTDVADKMIDYESQSSVLTKEYYIKFKKVLPPLKIILLLRAEMDFKKMVLKEAHGRGGMH